MKSIEKKVEKLFLLKSSNKDYIASFNTNSLKSCLNMGYIFWTISIFSYYFQFPFKFLSYFIVPSIFIYMLIKHKSIIFKSEYFYLYIVFVVFICLEAIQSIFNEVPFLNIVRFFSIFLVIPLSSNFIINNFTKENKILIFLSVAKSLLLIYFTYKLFSLGTHVDIRNWANINGLGDIYFATKYVPRVQVHGNALLLVAFILNFHFSKKISISNFIIFVGILIAGNLAFYGGLFIFFIYEMLLYMRKNKNIIKKIAIFFVILAISISFILYFKNRNELKTKSNETKIKQANILIQDTNILYGNGLGNLIYAITPTRIYNGNIYYELQNLYVYNQIGIIGFAFFYTLVLINVINRGVSNFIIYTIYLIYSFFNPYCFDVTQIIATIAICNIRKKKHENFRNRICL